MLSSKIGEILNSHSNIQINSISSNICILLKTYYICLISYFLGKLSLEKTSLNLGSFRQYSCVSMFAKGSGETKHFYFHNQFFQSFSLFISLTSSYLSFSFFISITSSYNSFSCEDDS